MTLFACLHGPGNLALLTECARGFSPHIEENPPDTVVFDVRGLEPLYGPPADLAQEIGRRVGVPAGIAIAPNPDAAIHAARGFGGIIVIERGKESAALAKLPINLLGGSPQTAELLHLWGVRTFGDFAKLPPLASPPAWVKKASNSRGSPPVTAAASFRNSSTRSNSRPKPSLIIRLNYWSLWHSF